MNRRLMLRLFVAMLLMGSTVRAGEPPRVGETPREILKEGRNSRPTFMVRLDTDRSDRTYLGGEVMTFRVRSERSGHLYLIAWSADGKPTCLFPNQYQKDNRIAGGQDVVVPAKEATFDLKAAPPYGAEVVKAIVTPEPLAELPLADLVRAPFTPLDPGRAKAILVTLRTRNNPESWAEHQIVVQTADPAKPRPTLAPRRVGLFIGVGKYRHRRIPRLSAPPADARGLAGALQLDAATILVDEEATLSAVERAFLDQIVAKTRPGDTVILYWSGHGGRFANSDGEEKDGYDEYLVPFDGNPDDSARTMLTDNMFGRWIQELDGRRIVVILDACHSAGQHAAGKGRPDPSEDGHLFEGLARRIMGAKDLNQNEVAFLASSTAAQTSMERRDGKQSVLTYYLIEKVRQTKAPLPLTEAFEYVRAKVPAYVEKAFDGSTQTPVLIDRTTPPLYLKQ